jgi:hypothetical protein
MSYPVNFNLCMDDISNHFSIPAKRSVHGEHSSREEGEMNFDELVKTARWVEQLVFELVCLL